MTTSFLIDTKTTNDNKTDSIDLLVTGSPILTSIEYKERHDKIEHCIHWKIYKYNGILDCEIWYEQHLEQMRKAKGATILCDFAIQNKR